MRNAFSACRTEAYLARDDSYVIVYESALVEKKRIIAYASQEYYFLFFSYYNIKNISAIIRSSIRILIATRTARNL